MGSNFEALKRYRLIDERLSNKNLPNPILQDIIDYCAQKLEKKIAQRTIQKDIQQMRHSKALGYFAPIVFSRSLLTYYYADPHFSINNLSLQPSDMDGLVQALHIIKQYQNIPALQELTQSLQKVQSLVQQRNLETQSLQIILDKPFNYKGAEYITDIQEAIKNSTLLKLSYQSYNRTQSTKYRLEPLVIKEYQYRFYLLANTISDNLEQKIRTFALDRVKYIQILKEKFTPTFFNQAQFFEHTIGISYAETAPENIELLIHPQSASYIKNKPIHASQTILKETPQGLHCSIHVVINTELTMLLKSLGSNIKILKPKALQKTILTDVLEVAKQYQK
jgi:predicted DNA-binding transcriptional regulator YafY